MQHSQNNLAYVDRVASGRNPARHAKGNPAVKFLRTRPWESSEFESLTSNGRKDSFSSLSEHSLNLTSATLPSRL